VKLFQLHFKVLSLIKRKGVPNDVGAPSYLFTELLINRSCGLADIEGCSFLKRVKKIRFTAKRKIDSIASGYWCIYTA
jgi:radical SAM superfamily enzyme with C-terminal helix-hairpin-helix motif